VEKGNKGKRGKDLEVEINGRTYSFDGEVRACAMGLEQWGGGRTG